MNTKLSDLTIGQLLKLALVGYGIYVGVCILLAILFLHMFLKAISGRGIFSLIGDFFR